MLAAESSVIFYNNEPTEFHLSHVQNGICLICKVAKQGNRYWADPLNLPSVYYDFFDESNMYPGRQQLEKDMIDRGYLPSE